MPKPSVDIALRFLVLLKPTKEKTHNAVSVSGRNLTKKEAEADKKYKVSYLLLFKWSPSKNLMRNVDTQKNRKENYHTKSLIVSDIRFPMIN